MSDARLSTSFAAHPKTKKLMRRLSHAGPLACIYLFLWAAANRSNGNLSGMTDEDIELAVDWAGEPGAFVAAMTEVGFLDGVERTRVIHDWAEHNPWASGAEMRSAKARWNAVKRHHGEAEADKQVPEYAAVRRAGSKESDASSSAPSTDGAMRAASSSNAPSPSPSPIPVERSPRGSRLTPDWQPSESDLAYARKHDVDADLEAEKFRNHWLAKSGKDAISPNWSARWRNWVLKHVEFAGNRRARGSPPKPSAHTGFNTTDYKKDEIEWNSN